MKFVWKNVWHISSFKEGNNWSFNCEKMQTPSIPTLSKEASVKNATVKNPTLKYSMLLVIIIEKASLKSWYLRCSLLQIDIWGEIWYNKLPWFSHSLKQDITNHYVYCLFLLKFYMGFQWIIPCGLKIRCSLLKYKMFFLKCIFPQDIWIRWGQNIYIQILFNVFPFFFLKVNLKAKFCTFNLMDIWFTIGGFKNL